MCSDGTGSNRWRRAAASCSTGRGRAAGPGWASPTGRRSMRSPRAARGPLARLTRAVNGARRQAWAAIEARHGALPGVLALDGDLVKAEPKTLRPVTGSCTLLPGWYAAAGAAA